MMKQILKYQSATLTRSMRWSAVLATVWWFMSTSLLAQDCTKTMTCNANIQVSLNELCTETITPRSMLKVLTAPESSYRVIVRDARGRIVPGNVVTSKHLGTRLEVSIFLDVCGMSCWGYAWVEDKLPPRIVNCDTVFVDCDDTLAAGIIVPRVTAVDACGPVKTKQLPDVIMKNPCPDTYERIVKRPWMFTDSSGNASSCVQVIMVRRTTFEDIEAPPNYDDLTNPAFECGQITDLLPTGAPHPRATGFPTNLGCENIKWGYKDLIFPVCGNAKKVLREWTVIDWCTGKDTVISQVIKILDRQGPKNPTHPTYVNVNTDPKKCTASYKFPHPGATDCGTYSYTIGYRLKNTSGVYGDTIYNINLIQGVDNAFTHTALPLGETLILYKMTDVCGNVSYSTMIVNVEDKEAPSAICEGFTVISIRENGVADLTALSINSGSEDNCKIVKYEIRRIGTVCNNRTNDFNYGPSVQFCCADLRSDPAFYHRVALRVTDHAGNVNECFTNVRVQDKQAPKIICPADITLECYEDYKNTTITGTPTATDNCGVRIMPFRDSLMLDKCGKGMIFRTWTAIDSQKLTGVCTQKITLINTDPFSENHIIFPRDTVVDACVRAELLTPEYLNSKPTFRPRTCAQLAVSYSDEFYTAADACHKIIRTWRVINWCDYDPNNKIFFTRTQKIIANEKTPPRIISGCVPRTIVSLEGDCEEVVHHRIEADDNCTPANLLRYNWEVDLFTNQTIDSVGTGAAASRKFPVGRHTMTYRVTDGCGNVARCSYIFTITDNKKPSPICVGELVWVLDKEGRAVVWAKDFNLKSEDFCGNTNNLKFSFSPSLSDSSRTFTCANLTNGVSRKIPLQMYVFDSDGNSEFCNVILHLQDSPLTNACPNTGGLLLVSGQVINSKKEAASNIEIAVMDQKSKTSSNVMTDKDGKYNYNASEQGGSYMIQPYKMDEVLEGVNTLDLVVLQRHLLGVKRMDNPYHLIAADIDNDKRIALNDIVALRRVVLGISEEFENNRPWRFVPKSHVFSEDKPFELQEFTEITNINASLSDQDFMILKTGDLDASFVANALTSRSKSDYSFEYETKGSEISFYASERIVLSGFEMNLHLHNFKDIKDGVLAIEHFHYDENQLKISYVRSEDKVIEKGDKLFTLVSGSSTNQILVKEAQNSLYNENLEILDLSLRPRSINELRPTVSPNPFNNTTTITFATEQNQVSTITFFDIQGKLIFTDKVNSSSEIGQYEIQRSILKSTGVYYIKIQSGAKTTSAKMILTD